MAKTGIPFNPFPLPVLKGLGEKCKGMGGMFGDAFPYLELELRQAELPYSKEEYASYMFVLFLFYAVVGFIVAALVSFRIAPDKLLLVSIPLGMVVGFLVLVQVSLYPKVLVKKKIRDLERNLVFALRVMLIEIKSGISLFDSMNTIANGDFGQVSLEFKKAVQQINSGEPEEDVLQKIASDNPSLFFRRALWQLVNGLKAGGDVSAIMAELVHTIGTEQKIQINKYGGSLRVLSLMFMMIGVIMPALGLTFLVILATFPQISGAITKMAFLLTVTAVFQRVIPSLQPIDLVFWGFLALIIFMQFMYLGMMKMNRPNLIGEQ
ncbi:MAG: type II secretion system F family protein [Candidatus Diapherotrites archaeon]